MEKRVLTEHSSSQFNNDVQELFNAVLKLGGLVELQFQQAHKAIDTLDIELANQVLLLDKKVNKEQSMLDNLVTHLLVQHNPAAFDLRMVLMAYKSASDLERIGDEISILAKFVVRSVKENNQKYKINFGFEDLSKLINFAELMLKIALDGFSHLESEVIGRLITHEEKMNQTYAHALNKIKTSIITKNESFDNVTDLVLLFRAMERVADHALNIGEYVFYMIEGKTVRQISKEKLKSNLELNKNN